MLLTDAANPNTFLHMMTEREKLAEEIRRFLKRTGIPPTRMSVEASGGKERGLIKRIMDGSDVTLTTAENLRAYMKAQLAQKKALKDRIAA